MNIEHSTLNIEGNVATVSDGGFWFFLRSSTFDVERSMFDVRCSTLASHRHSVADLVEQSQ
ncbi:MAG: hypothetical protein O2983_10370, partial [Planctomycetota bacterium]|nr:hypothetical protein [Planctomycetota bacterium]